MMMTATEVVVKQKLKSMLVDENMYDSDILYFASTYYGIVMVCLLLFNNNLFGQVGSPSISQNIVLTIPEIAILDIEPNTNAFTVSLNAPNEAGASALLTNNNTTKWINYSSSFPTSGANRTILVNTLSTVPSGLNLNLMASNYSGSGAGTMGVSNGTIALSTSPQVLISGIGRGYTGDGENNGHQLSFSLSITDFALLDANNSKSVTVIYTITD